MFSDDKVVATFTIKHKSLRESLMRVIIIIEYNTEWSIHGY